MAEAAASTDPVVNDEASLDRNSTAAATSSGEPIRPSTPLPTSASSSSGIDFIGKPEGYGQKKRDEYTAKDYHKPSDDVKPDWDLSGAVEEAHVLLEVGYKVAQGDTWPEWKPGTEFKALREEMLRKR